MLPDGNFRVHLDNDHDILAYTAGKMRKFRIRTGVGDRVIVEMSPYDLRAGASVSATSPTARWPPPRLAARPSGGDAASRTRERFECGMG